MQTIGERLEEARKRKGISVREAAEATKIRGDYLQKFEANSFDLDLPPLYVRGFVRAYARYLGLDAERFIAEYDSVVAAEGRNPKRESREVYGRVEFGNEGGAASAPAGGGPDQALMLKYGLYGGGALVALIILYVLISVLTSSKPAPKPAAQPATTAAQQAAITQPVDGAQTLTFTALDKTSIKVVQESDGKVLADSLVLTPGETRSFRKTGALVITVGDRTKLRMEVNGRLLSIPRFPPPSDGNYGRFRLD